VRSSVVVDGLEQVVVPVRVQVVIGQLRPLADLRQIVVEQPQRDALTEDVHHGWDLDVDLTAPVVGGVWIIDTCTLELRWSSSVSTLSVNPLQACLAPQ
jgi:hypothetical protein